MSTRLAHAGSIGSLTEEQRLAATTRRRESLFLEAGPGTGKTTVSAQRFGVQRFAPEHRHDPRAVVAVSFTRAATNTLRRRVQRLWGSSALEWPHRIVTLDTIVGDLLHDLLRSGLLVWPNTQRVWGDRPITLEVHDSWASFGKVERNNTIYGLSVSAPAITIQYSEVRANDYTVPAAIAVAQLQRGVCTHQDVRGVLEQALLDPACATRVQQRLSVMLRALIVDEVFDANDLDIAIIELAIRAGVAVTMVGDPWQALYLFRGARPHLIPKLLERTGVRELKLTQSFRWREESQRVLAETLREGRGLVLPVADPAGGPVEMDVVLALRWAPLWGLGPAVLPLAFGSFKGSREEAAATLLLNQMTRRAFDLDATYLTDALTALAISDRDELRRREPDLQQVIDILRGPAGRPTHRAAYLRLAQVVTDMSPHELRAPHWRYTDRLGLLQDRLSYGGPLTPGLTTHQAKGGEWEIVGVRLTEHERNALGAGLSHEDDTHRKLYVACTRAHNRTVEIPERTGPPGR